MATPLYWELSVLSHAAAYPNLSAASTHVGLSQPQLSRIIAKLEAETGAQLLDRSAKRKSAWTPLAHQLAESYNKFERRFSDELQGLLGASSPDHLAVLALEGLIPLAVRFCHRLLQSAGVRTITLDIHDLNTLEEHFFRGDADLVFTAREPGRKKHRYVRVLGYQSLDSVGKPGDTAVLSGYEYGRLAGRKRGPDPAAPPHALISNSLAVRRAWIDRFGGQGVMPSPVRPTRAGRPGSDDQPVYLLGHDRLGDTFWTKRCPATF